MRMLHTMVRVGDLERSLRFCCEVLGMQLLRRYRIELIQLRGRSD